jgi:hypothetical protein
MLNRAERRRLEAIERKEHKRVEKAWMQWALRMMCFPRFLNRLIDPPQRDIELNWRLVGESSPTFDLLLELDKKPYPLGFSSLKSFWGDHIQYCHEVACALKLDLMRMGQNESDWKWIIVKDCLGTWHAWLEHDGWVIQADGNEIVVTPVEVTRSKTIWVRFYPGPTLPVKVVDGRLILADEVKKIVHEIEEDQLRDTTIPSLSRKSVLVCTERTRRAFDNGEMPLEERKAFVEMSKKVDLFIFPDSLMPDVEKEFPGQEPAVVIQLHKTASSRS